MTMTVEEMVDAYIRIRDHKEAASREFKEKMKRVDEAQKVLEAKLQEHLLTTGAEHVGTAAGTVYKITKNSTSVQDAEGFMQWVRDNDAWDALDVKANVTFVRDTLAAGTPIPGVKFSSFSTVGVRRS